MADHWLSLIVSLIGLIGLFILLRPMPGAVSTTITHVHRQVVAQQADPIVTSQSVRRKDEGEE